MKKKLTSLIAIGLGLVVYCLGLAAPAVVAVTGTPTTNNGVGQALEIAPPVMTLSADPGQSIKVQISLRDVSNGDLIVTGQANDFVAAGEDGTPKILLDNQDNNNPYTLKDWVAPLASLTLIPKQIKNLPVTINVPANASPGGHYGVIRFTATPPDLHGTGVSLSASLGALILLTVNGPTNENLSVQEFSVNHDGKTGHLFESAPLNFVEKIKNSGNIHEEPAGQVAITDMFGKKIAAVNVNLPPRNILPASTRKFTEPLDGTVIGNKKLFGHYNATLTLTYGASKKVLTSSVSFWVIPYRLIGGIIVVLVGGFFALRFFIKRYNRRIIAKAQGTSKPKHPKK
jgi:hypothetical protein